MAAERAVGWLRGGAKRCVLGAALSCLSLGCSLALQRDHDQCQTSEDCQALGAAAVCTSAGICERLTTQAGKRAQLGCTIDRDCGEPWSICTETVCRKLDDQGCLGLGDVDTSDPGARLPIAILVPKSELDGQGGQRTVAAARTAIDAFNQARHDAPVLPQVVGVVCDETAQAALEALRESGVRLVIGPTSAEAIVAVAASLSRQAVLFAPFADAPALANSSLASDVVSCKPNARETREVEQAAIAFVSQRLQDAKLVEAGGVPVVAFSQEELRLGFPAAGPETGVKQVEYDASRLGQGLVSALAQQAPGASLLVAPSSHVDWSLNIVALDAERLSTKRPLPYYLLRDKQANALDVIRDKLAQLRRDTRAVGLDYHLSDANRDAHKRFAMALRDTTGSAVVPGLDYVHDCVYLAIYAALAAELRYSQARSELSAKSVLVGLGALVGGNTVISVGQRDIALAARALEATRGADRTVDLLGGSGDLDFGLLSSIDQVVLSASGFYLSPDPADSELYCVDVVKKTFCDTGIVFPNVPGPTRGVSQCACFLPQ